MLAKIEDKEDPKLLGEGNDSTALIDPSLVTRVADLLCESGTRLNLGGSRRRDGRWGLSMPDTNNDGRPNDGDSEKENIDLESLESLVQDYCSSVEAKIFRKTEEIEEVRAFCNYLESKVITTPIDSSDI